MLQRSGMHKCSFRRSSSLLACARVLYLILISDLVISLLLVYVGKCSIIFGCVGGCHSGKHLFASNVLVLAALCNLLLQGDGNASHAISKRYGDYWPGFWSTCLQVLNVCASFQQRPQCFPSPVRLFGLCLYPHHQRQEDGLWSICDITQCSSGYVASACEVLEVILDQCLSLSGRWKFWKP